jgi:predicted nuclease of predicted toxin-antitoxin system
VRTRSPSRLEPLIFFLDGNLGKYKIADALRQAGVEVQIHDDHFRQGTPDEDWLRDVGQRGWIVLTKDTQIRYRAPERAALMQARVRAFVLTAGNLSAREMADIFLKALPAIRRFVANHQPPFIAKVTRSSTVSMVINK